MDIIITAIYAAFPFYISSFSIILINMLLIDEKRELLKIGFKLKEKVITFGLMLSIILVLSVTIGNNLSVSFENLKLASINMVPFKDMYFQYLFALKGDVYYVINLFGNILLFIPFGFFLAIYYKDDVRERSKIIITAIIISFFIEFLQLFSGRSSDINDIILNTTGVILGRFIFRYFNIIFGNFFNTINLRCINISNSKEVKGISTLQLIIVSIFFILNLL